MDAPAEAYGDTLESMMSKRQHVRKRNCGTAQSIETETHQEKEVFSQALLLASGYVIGGLILSAAFPWKRARSAAANSVRSMAGFISRPIGLLTRSVKQIRLPAFITRHRGGAQQRQQQSLAPVVADLEQLHNQIADLLVEGILPAVNPVLPADNAVAAALPAAMAAQHAAAVAAAAALNGLLNQAVADSPAAPRHLGSSSLPSRGVVLISRPQSTPRQRVMAGALPALALPSACSAGTSGPATPKHGGEGQALLKSDMPRHKASARPRRRRQHQSSSEGEDLDHRNQHSSGGSHAADPIIHPGYRGLPDLDWPAATGGACGSDNRADASSVLGSPSHVPTGLAYDWLPRVDVPSDVQAHWAHTAHHPLNNVLDAGIPFVDSAELHQWQSLEDEASRLLNPVDTDREGPDAGLSEVMSLASIGSDAVNLGDMDSFDGLPQFDADWELPDNSVLGLPACVGECVLKHLDADARRVLRLVSRSMYFEASKTVRTLTVTPSNLETLVAMPLHLVMPSIRTLVFKAAPPAGSEQLPNAYYGPRAPVTQFVVQLESAASSPTSALPDVQTPGGAAALQDNGGADQDAAGPGAGGGYYDAAGGAGGMYPDSARSSHDVSLRLTTFNTSLAASGLLVRFLHEVLPHLKELEVIDLSEAPLYQPAHCWSALLENLPPNNIRILMREHSAWARGAMGLLGTPASLLDTTDHYAELYDALRKANKINNARQQPLQQLQQGSPVPAGIHGGSICIDLLGITVRRNTAARLPQLCNLQCITSLTLYGKSAAAATHGHRLAGHLAVVAGLRQLTRLELVSYEDVSDIELAPLAACTRLKHLYLDSLFIKQASGPVFPSIESLTAARIKFILRPLTCIFPALQHLRLGVLHSELNKKISSASLSCLAGCSEQLTTLCVCPVLWKGQWQVLPTLPGIRRLQLIHCRDIAHLREVLRVVGRSKTLETLELHAASAAVPAWPGASADEGGPGSNNVLQGNAGDIATVAAAAVMAAISSGSEAETALAAGAAAASVIEDALPDTSGSVVDANLWQGLAGMKNLKKLVIAESSGRLVRHLVGAELPGLTQLEFRRMGIALKLPELQAAVLAVPTLQTLTLAASGNFSAAAAVALPAMLDRPGLVVDWRATCFDAPLLFSRDCGVSLHQLD